jgi:hypothetical protein
MSLALGLVAIGDARGQPPAAPEPAPTPFTLRPAAEPVPALRYRLLPERRDLVPGNAAVLYHRASLMLKEAPPDPNRAAKAEEDMADWLAGPLDKLPKDAARALLERRRNALNELDQAALRAFCDWEYDQRTEGISLVLPELQMMRSLARLQALRARLAVAEGDPARAIAHLRAGFALSRHVADGPTLIQALVGVAIATQMTRVVEELIQQPGAPNLYWALANRPRPFIPMGRALETERRILEKELPRLAEVEGRVWSVEEARQAGDQLLSIISQIGGPSPTGLQRAAQRAILAAGIARYYPEARRALLAAGRTEAQLDAMPTFQVVLLQGLADYEKLRDDTYKWLGLPFWQARAGLEKALPTDRPPPASEVNPLLILFRVLVPALDSARAAEVRLDRQLEMIQAIEAIRLHAAAHGNALPATLAEIADAPVPLDPATNVPFEYRKVDDTRATLATPPLPGGPDRRMAPFRYDITLSR